jgi:sugar lactone lactonase YvrE
MYFDGQGRMLQTQATLAIKAENKIGECPVWDKQHQRLLWVDHQVGTLHEARADGAGGWRQTQRWDLGRPIAAVIPRQPGGLVVTTGTEILLFDEALAKCTPFVSLSVDPALIRLNDAKCDAQGRLWAGTFTTDFSARAALYRIDPDGTVTPALESVALSNGLDWSPDGSTFYYIDSLALTIEAFDFDAPCGTIGNRRTLVTFNRGEGGGNGMTVDREGCLWVALTGSGEVRRYAPNGTLLGIVKVPTTGVTSCAFGGPDGGELFITSRSGRVHEQIARMLSLTPERMEDNGPEAGGLFVCRPGPTGPPATPFAA